VEDSAILQLGVGGIFAVLVIQMVLNFIKPMMPNIFGVNAQDEATKEITKILYEIRHLTKELHTWHDRRDEDGVPVWYIRRSLEDSIEKLAEAVTALSLNASAQTHALEQIVTQSAQTHAAVERLRDN